MSLRTNDYFELESMFVACIGTATYRQVYLFSMILQLNLKQLPQYSSVSVWDPSWSH